MVEAKVTEPKKKTKLKSPRRLVEKTEPVPWRRAEDDYLDKALKG